MSDVEEEDWRSHLVRNWVSTESLSTIGIMLSTEDNAYETLGSKLGYKPAKIAEFKVRGSRSDMSPGRCLLEHWQQKKKTTVLVLLQHLIQMDRDDIVKYLEKEVRDCSLTIVIDKKFARSPKVNRSQKMSQVIDNLVASDDKLRLYLGDRRLEPVDDSDTIWDQKAEQCMGSQHDFKSTRIQRSRTTRVRKAKYQDPTPRDVKSHNISVDQRKAMRESDSEEVFPPIILPIRESLPPCPNCHECPVLVQECGATGESATAECLEEQGGSPARQPGSTDNGCDTDSSLILSLKSDATLQRQARANQSGNPSDSKTPICEAQLRSKDHSSTGGMPPQDTRRQGRTDIHLEQGAQSLSLDSHDTVSCDVTIRDTLHIDSHGHGPGLSYTSGPGQAAGGPERGLHASTQECGRQLPGYRADATDDNKIQRILALYTGREGAYILRPSRTMAGAICISVIHRYQPHTHEIVSFRVHEMNCERNGRREIRFYLFDDGPTFSSVDDLIKHYHINPMQQTGAVISGPKLRQPIEN